MSTFPSFDQTGLDDYLATINEYDPRRRAPDPTQGFVGSNDTLSDTHWNRNINNDEFGGIVDLYDEEMQNRLPTDELRNLLQEEADIGSGVPLRPWEDRADDRISSIQDEAGNAAVDRRMSAQTQNNAFRNRPLDQDPTAIRIMGLDAMDSPRRNELISWEKELYTPENIAHMRSRGYEPNLTATTNSYAGWQKMPGYYEGNPEFSTVTPEKRAHIEQLMVQLQEEANSRGAPAASAAASKKRVDRYRTGAEYFDVDSQDELIRSWSEQYIVADEDGKKELRGTHPSIDLEEDRNYRYWVRELEAAEKVINGLPAKKDMTPRLERAKSRAERQQESAERAIKNRRAKVKDQLSAGLTRASGSIQTAGQKQSAIDAGATNAMNAAVAHPSSVNPPVHPSATTTNPSVGPPSPAPWPGPVPAPSGTAFGPGTTTNVSHPTQSTPAPPPSTPAATPAATPAVDPPDPVDTKIDAAAKTKPTKQKAQPASNWGPGTEAKPVTFSNAFDAYRNRVQSDESDSNGRSVIRTPSLGGF